MEINQIKHTVLGDLDLWLVHLRPWLMREEPARSRRVGPRRPSCLQCGEGSMDHTQVGVDIPVVQCAGQGMSENTVRFQGHLPAATLPPI